MPGSWPRGALPSAMRAGIMAVGAVLILFASPGSAAAGTLVTVDNPTDLRQALAEAEPGDTINILPGYYFLPRTRLRQSGRTDAPITVQPAIPETVSLWAGSDTLFEVSGAHWHFRHLDLQGHSRADHAIRVRGPAHGLRVEDSRLQNFHGAIHAEGEGGEFADDVRILRNVFVNDTPRSSSRSIAALAVTGGENWLIRKNFFADIGVVPEATGRHAMAAFVAGGARGAVIDQNLVICEWRHAGGQRLGLSLGGTGTSRRAFDDRQGGWCAEDCPEALDARLTNNVVYNCPDEPGIYLNRAESALVAHNTVYNAFGIQARYPETQVRVVNNLVSGTIWARDDAQVDARDNRTTGWFDSANYLASIKWRLALPAPEHWVIFNPWADWVIRSLHGAAVSTLDWLADSRLGKGLSPFERWLVDPAAGDFRLNADRVLMGEGAEGLVAHDFCGEARRGPGDLGAFEYKAGGCALPTVLQRRHGEYFTAVFNDDGVRPPPDWSRHPVAAGADNRETEPARVLRADPSNYRDQVRRLEPGDHLRLAAGEYPRSLVLSGLKGTADRPIIISGPSEGEPAVFKGRRGANTVRLGTTAHIVLRHLTLDGGRENISAVALQAEADYSHDITLEHLTIRNYDGSQGNSGITSRAPAWNWTLRHNDIRRVGTGMYLGRPDGSAPFINGLIEHNTLAQTLGYNIQIKHQNRRDQLPPMPDGPRQTVLRYNLLSKAEGGSGERPRPNLLLGHFPPEGVGQHDRYLVYGNLFHENPHERLFQGEGNLHLYNNLFVNHGGDGLIVLRHNDVPKTVQILNNTVLAQATGIRIDAPDLDYDQVVAGNAVFADTPLSLARGVRQAANLTAPFDQAAEWLVRPHGGQWDLDLFPRRGALRRDERLPVSGADLPGFERDYNRRTREVDTYGAYDGATEDNPGREPGIGPGAGPLH